MGPTSGTHHSCRLKRTPGQGRAQLTNVDPRQGHGCAKSRHWRVRARAVEAALGTAVGTLQPEWYWTRALTARAVRAAALLVAESVCSGSVRARHREAVAQGRVRKVDLGWCKAQGRAVQARQLLKVRAAEAGATVAQGLGAVEKQEAGRENNLISKRLPLLLLL